MKTYQIKTPPETVLEYFKSRFNGNNILFKFYWYWEDYAKTTRIYGCNIFKDGNFYHNATQATMEDYQAMLDNPF